MSLNINAKVKFKDTVIIVDFEDCENINNNLNHVIKGHISHEHSLVNVTEMYLFNDYLINAYLLKSLVTAVFKKEYDEITVNVPNSATEPKFQYLLNYALSANDFTITELDGVISGALKNQLPLLS
ncbi:MAG: hypothetical protein K2Y14_01045 [Burkholderiales bacterium]|nr:hypothetical protein [Burkholderiales bacterium]